MNIRTLVKNSSTFLLIMALFFLCPFIQDASINASGNPHRISWYNVYLNGSKIGYYKVEIPLKIGKESPNQKHEDMHFILKQSDQFLVVNSHIDKYYDRKLNLTKLEMVVTEGGMQKKTIAEFSRKKGKVFLNTMLNGKNLVYELDIPDESLSELQLEQKIKTMGLKSGYSFSYNSFLPDIGKFGRCNITVHSPETVFILGESRHLFPIERTIEGFENRLRLWIDTDFSIWKSQLEWPRRRFQLERTSKKNALNMSKVIETAFDVVKHASLNILVSPSMARKLKRGDTRFYRAVFKISGKFNPNMIHGGGQRIIQRAKVSNITLEVNTDPVNFIYESDENCQKNPNPVGDEFKESNLYIQSDHPILKNRIASIINGKSRWNTLLNIRKWVSKNIKWTSGYGFRDALSTLEQGEGDCSEIAVLTTALCRSAGIPARIAIGYKMRETFADQYIMVPHMWCEAFVDNMWYPLDGTNDTDPTPFMIRFFFTSLHPQEMNSVFAHFYSGSKAGFHLISIDCPNNKK